MPPPTTLRLSPRAQQAVRAILAGECRTIKEAAAKIGMTRQWLGKLLQTAHGQAFIESETRKTLHAGQARAARRLLELCEAKSEAVSFDASKHLLGLAGHVPVEHRHVTGSIAVAGYVIRLDGSEDRGEVVDVRPEPIVPVFSASPAGSALEQTTVRAKAEPELVPRPALEDRPAEPSPSWPGERTIDDDERADMQRRLGAARVARRLRGEADDEPD